MLREIQSRIKEPHYVGLRDGVLARIKSGKLTEDMPVSAVLDSLDTVELTIELEELGIETTVPINSVGDLLWLFKALDLRRRKRALSGSVFMLLLILAGALQACRGYKDRPNLTPLMNAAAHCDLVRVREQLAHGADVKQRTDKGETALYEAIERSDTSTDNLPTVDALLKSGADPNEREIFGASALSISLTRDYANSAVTLRLLEAGAIVPHDCGEGDSLLSLATQDSSVEVMRALIDRGAPVNCESRGASALYWAAINGQADRVSLLLQSGADPTIQVGSKTLLEAATCPNCEPRVRANFAKTRDLIENARRSAPTK
jgi:hypothetical protein